MPIGLFVITHDEIKGPLLSAGYFRRRIDISKDLIAQMYLSHAGYASNACIEMILPQYKIFSNYTGDQARESGKEGILAMVMEPDETCPYLELFLRQNLEFCIAEQSEEILETVLETKYAKYCQLLNLFDRVNLENVDLFAVIQRKTDSHLLLAKFGSEPLTNDMIIQNLGQERNSLSKGNYVAHIANMADTDFYLLVHSGNGNPKEIQQLITQTAELLKNNINFTWEILSMALFPQLITFQLDESQELLHTFNSHKSLQVNLSRANDYRKQFRYFLTAVLTGQIYPICI